MIEAAVALPESTSPPITTRLVTIVQVAAFLKVSKSTAERMSAAGKLPQPRKIGRLNKWDLRELEDWLNRPKPDGSLLNRKEWKSVWDGLVKARSSRSE